MIVFIDRWDFLKIFLVTMTIARSKFSTNFLLCFSFFLFFYQTIQVGLLISLWAGLCCCCSWMWPIFMHVALSGADMCPWRSGGRGAPVIGWRLAGWCRSEQVSTSYLTFIANSLHNFPSSPLPLCSAAAAPSPPSLTLCKKLSISRSKELHGFILTRIFSDVD